MKLDNAEFKEFKDLEKKIKEKSATQEDVARFKELAAKKNTKGSNDLAWWKNYPELLKDCVNLPFNYRGGDSYSLTVTKNNSITARSGIPGVAVVRTYSSIGYSTKSSDAFNNQMRQLWLDMHRKYRGMGGYQRADLGMAILAIKEFYVAVSTFERIYGVCNTYKIMNKNVPYTLFEGLGIDKTVLSNLAQFRYGLNYRIQKAQQLCLPKGIAAIDAERLNSLFLFKDSANSRANVFCFDRAEFGIYDATTLSTGGSVKFIMVDSYQNGVTPINGTPAWTMQGMFNLLDDMLDALLNDDDIAKMCSDLIAAYGPESVEVMPYVPELLQIEPVHDYERLLQFHNLTVIGEAYTRWHGDIISDSVADQRVNSYNNWHTIYQKDDVIYDRLVPCGSIPFSGYIPVSASPNADLVPEMSTLDNQDTYKCEDAVFDTWVDKPGELEIACGTRFMSLAERPHSFIHGGTTYYTSTLVACPINPVYCIDVYDYVDETSVVSHQFLAGQWAQGNLSEAQFEASSKFDWFPLIYMDKNPGIHVIGDQDNFTIVKLNDLGKLHEACILSAFKIPKVSYIS